MKKVEFKKAIGQALAHDIVKIDGQKFKGVAFKRGYIIKEEDEDDFLRLGKSNFYILEEGDEDLVHEEDAAQVIFDKCNNGDFIQSEIALGKINFIAHKEGYFKVSEAELIKMNLLGEISLASINNNTYVKKGDIVASARIIPLFCTNKKIQDINNLVFKEDIFKIVPIKIKNVGLITTGSEVYSKKVKDGFYPILKEKLNKYNLHINKKIIVEDNKGKIKNLLEKYLNDDLDLILLTGGMSVDPDDLTPGAIKEAGVEILSYGSPIIPGSMFLIGYYKGKTILGLPGAVIFEPKTAFDIFLPQILLKETISQEDIARSGVGGLLDGKH